MVSVDVRAIHVGVNGIEAVEGEGGFLSKPLNTAYAFLVLRDGTTMRLAFEDGKVFWRGRDGARDTVLEFRRHTLAESGDIVEVCTSLEIRVDDMVVGSQLRPARDATASREIGRAATLVVS